MRQSNYFQSHYSNIYKDLKKEYQSQETSFFKLNFEEIMTTLDKEKSVCLDLGCGFGNFIYSLKKRGFKKVSGIDLDNDQIEICQKEFPEYEFFAGDFFEFLNKTEQKYDLISCFSVLEHIPKEKTSDFLRLLRRRLSEKGIIVLSTPNMETLFGNTGGRYSDFTHQNGFTYYSLLQVLKMSGFNEKEYSIEIFGSPKKEKSGLLFLVYKLFSKFALFLTKGFFILLRYQMPKISSYVLCCVIKRRNRPLL